MNTRYAPSITLPVSQSNALPRAALNTWFFKARTTTVTLRSNSTTQNTLKIPVKDVQWLNPNFFQKTRLCWQHCSSLLDCCTCLLDPKRGVFLPCSYITLKCSKSERVLHSDSRQLVTSHGPTPSSQPALAQQPWLSTYRTTSPQPHANLPVTAPWSTAPEQQYFYPLWVNFHEWNYTM